MCRRFVVRRFVVRRPFVRCSLFVVRRSVARRSSLVAGRWSLVVGRWSLVVRQSYSARLGGGRDTGRWSFRAELVRGCRNAEPVELVPRQVLLQQLQVSLRRLLLHGLPIIEHTPFRSRPTRGATTTIRQGPCARLTKMFSIRPILSCISFNSVLTMSFSAFAGVVAERCARCDAMRARLMWSILAQARSSSV